MGNLYVVMGVSGCGKTTIGKLLAQRLEIPFYDADDFHPEENIEKMTAGMPLNDKDRAPWLALVAAKLKEWEQGEGAVLACSALKETYRKQLFVDATAFAKAKKNFIFLSASYELINNRLEGRENHFFNTKLLKSQFEILELPTYGLQIDASQSQESTVKEILQRLH